MKRTSFSVATLISAGRHPVSGVPRVTRGDAVAMALAHRLAGDAARVVHAGKTDEPALQDYLAMGATNIEVVPVDAGSDALLSLPSYLKDVDVVLTGLRAETGLGSGLLPYALAHALGRPVIANVLDVRADNTATEGLHLKIRQFLPKGQRRQIAGSPPIVLAVHPAAHVELKYAYRRRLLGRIEAVAQAGTEQRVAPAIWTIDRKVRRPVRLNAQEKKSSHARMTSATVAEAKAGVVAFEGTSVDKAQVILNYLREHRLVDF